MRSAIIVFTLFLVGSILAAEEPKETGWRGNVTIGASVVTGNADTSTFTVGFKADKTFKQPFEWLNSGSFLTSTAEGDKTAEKLVLSSRLNWTFTPRLHLFAEIQGMRDKFKDYRYQYLPALGIGYTFIDNKKIQLSAHGGVALRIIKYYSSGNKEDDLALKLGNRFTWAFSKTAELKQSLEWIPEFSALGDYFLQAELSLAASLGGHWAISITISETYDSAPISPDIEKSDTTITAGITKKF
jgi:putative salt-induced outer membrane protein YdiY